MASSRRMRNSGAVATSSSPTTDTTVCPEWTFSEISNDSVTQPFPSSPNLSTDPADSEYRMGFGEVHGEQRGQFPDQGPVRTIRRTGGKRKQRGRIRQAHPAHPS